MPPHAPSCPHTLPHAPCIGNTALAKRGTQVDLLVSPVTHPQWSTHAPTRPRMPLHAPTRPHTPPHATTRPNTPPHAPHMAPHSLRMPPTSPYTPSWSVLYRVTYPYCSHTPTGTPAQYCNTCIVVAIHPRPTPSPHLPAPLPLSPPHPTPHTHPPS